MKQLRLTGLVCLLFTLAGAGAVSADVALGQSGGPVTQFQIKLTQFFGRAGGTPAVSEARNTERVHYSAVAGVRSSKGATKITFSVDFIADQPAVEGGAEWRCLTEALYFEARGESIRGQFAVAEVILNRVDSRRFPGTVCKVIHQGTGRKFQCQFTYTCDGNKETIREKSAWENVGKIAHLMLGGTTRVLTGGATHYHTTAVRPRWAKVFPLTTTIGVHRFYRMPIRTASNG